MPCIVTLITLAAPRLTMFFFWLLTNWFSRAFDSVLWPVLGFLFMPYTTLAYMAAMLNNNHTTSGFWLVLVIVAVLVDLGVIGGSRHHGSRVVLRGKH